MILIAQSDRSPRNGALAQLLTDRGYLVLVANSTGEAYRVVKHMRPTVVVMDSPPVRRCPFVLCSLIRAGMDEPPRMIALADIQDPDQRSRCRECMTLLDPATAPEAVAEVVAGVLPRSDTHERGAYPCCSQHP